MRTFRLWFENDTEIARFKRLRFEEVHVPLADVLFRGIHPWQGDSSRSKLKDRFIQALNEEEFKLKELEQFKYCEDVSFYDSRFYYRDGSQFEEMLRQLNEGIYFVENLSYPELLEISRERLRKTWSHKVAHQMLSRTCSGFDKMRSFLKAKDKNIKLSSYQDIDRYDLGSILSLEDFEGEDGNIIGVGLPLTNFRSVKFLGSVADKRGFLRLKESIDDFQITARNSLGAYCGLVNYNCVRQGEVIHFRPELDKDRVKRDTARQIASRWRIDDGRYCFTTDITRVSEMIDKEAFQIEFRTLDYLKQKEGETSTARLEQSSAQTYSVGSYLTVHAAGYAIREMLRSHNVSMSGRKEDLMEKLAQLAARVYEKHAPELDEYFSANRFIRLLCSPPGDPRAFPLLEGLDLRNMIITMYMVKHLRGNAILEAKHNNDTFDLLSLARSLIKREVSVEGAFMRVE